MKVAIGAKAHSGWAAIVVVAVARGGPEALEVLDRRRIELVDDAGGKHPYHAAELLTPDEGRAFVAHVVAMAGALAVREIRAACGRARESGHEATVCAIAGGSAMPEWTYEQITAVHMRMHKAEGALFRDALIHGARRCGLATASVPDELIAERTARLASAIARVGKVIGPPWTRDQKDASVAAVIALETRPR